MSVFNHVQRVRILYKTILKLHRGLPVEFKALGDLYVRDEFKRHKKCQPNEAAAFMTEWVVSSPSFASSVLLEQLLPLLR